MKVYNINSIMTPINFGVKKYDKNNSVHTATNYNNPLKECVTTAGAWFMFGVVLDFLSRKISFFKSPTKNSFAINGLIAVTAGVVSAYKAMSRKN